MLEAKRLTKRYGTLTALDGLDLNVAPGETLGLLGPNGAGKTTTLRMMAGLSCPTEGSVRVGGRDPWQEPGAVRQSMGVMFEGALYERQTVLENLELFAGLYQVPAARAREALSLTGVEELAKRKAGQLSRGQRQRVALARALIHRPQLVFLDEPTSGLDPTSARDFHHLIKRMQQEGTTVVLSSHDMAEVDLLCHRVAILDRGRLMALNTPTALKTSFGRRQVKAQVETAKGPTTVEWDLDAPTSAQRFAEVSEMGRILSLHSTEASLADVFVHLTGRELP